MNVEVRHRPSFATLFVTLAPGEHVVAESDAMASMSSTCEMRTRFNGGFLRGVLRKLFAGESLFVNEFSCAEGAGSAELVLTQATPGDIECIELDGTELWLQPSAYVASEPGVTLGLGWAGFRSWFGREGLFRLKVSGRGRVWFGAYGGVHAREIDGEYVVDTGHLVAYEPSVAMRVGLSGGIFSSFFGGEGFVSRMSGRGRIYLQSRSIDGLAAWTNGHLW